MYYRKYFSWVFKYSIIFHPHFQVVRGEFGAVRGKKDEIR